MRTIILIIIATICFSCQPSENSAKVSGVPSSNIYRPINPGESESLKKANKRILPDDVRRNIKFTLNEAVVWTGIVDTIIFWKPNDSVSIIDISLQHRYYDFIEDYSLQQEKMFVSPYGEGNYIFRQMIDPKILLEEVREDISKSIFKECMLFTYGIVDLMQDSIPVLQAENIRVVFPENYATNIFSYKVERDKNNSVIISNNGWPKLIEFKRLMIPKSGRNQMGSRLNNSTK